MQNKIYGKEEKMIEELHTICPIKQKLEIIDKHCTESRLEVYDDSALFECNPFEGEVWLVIEGLKYIDELNEIRIEKSQRPYKEDDTITVRW